MRQQLKRLENCAQRDDGRLTMKSQLIAIVAAVLVVGCDESPPTADVLALIDAVAKGKTEAVQKCLAAGTDVNAMDEEGKTPLDWAKRRPEIVDLLRKHGGKTEKELEAEGK